MKYCDRLVRTAGLTKMLGAMVVVAALLGRTTAAESMVPSLGTMQAEADRVWRLGEQGDLTGAGNQSEALVLVADKLRACGKLETAREYFRRAGVLRPWDLETKLRYAEVLRQLGDEGAARDMAAQVLTFAETDRLIAASGVLIDVPAQPELPALARLTPAAGEVVLGLVPTPETEHWLLAEVGRTLSTLLGVRVGVVAEPLVLGVPDRTGRSQLANNLRQSLPWGEKRMALYLPGGKLVPPQMLGDEQVINIMLKLLEREAGPDQLAAFHAQLAQADAQRQWAATTVLNSLGQKYAQPEQGRIVYLALVPVELFTSSAPSVFGSALPDGNCGVISYYRFAANFTGEPPKRARLVDRTCKQMLSSLGFALGVPRCADLRCARSYPRTLAEHDAKGAGLCSDCRAGFAKALGHALPVGE
jgi:predicted Zn-dependent protease